MSAERISKRVVDAIVCPVGKDRIFLWDGTLSGFGVCAYPSGTKVYVVQYRKGRSSHRLTIGRHGRLTPTEARSIAVIKLADVEKGNDPADQRRAARAVRTFREVSEEFLRLHAGQKRKERTEREYRRIIDSYILPALGTKRIVELKRADVAALHTSMSSTPYQANRTVAVVSAIWNWAARRDEVEHEKNPASRIDKYREKARQRFLTTEEFILLGDTLREAESTGLKWAVDETTANSSMHLPEVAHRRTVPDPYAVAAIRLLIFTGARLNEILRAKWSYVDLDRNLMFLKDSKTGAKPLYLSEVAVSILTSIPRVEGNPFIIAGANAGKPRADLKRPWAAIRRAARLDGFRIHDIRHSFASVGVGASMGLPIVGNLLGQSNPKTTQRYAHLDADPMNLAVNRIGINIAEKMGEIQKLIPVKPSIEGLV